VVFLALPAINRDLGVGLQGQQWIVNGYLLSVSALLLVAGSLADRSAAAGYSCSGWASSALHPLLVV